MRYHLLPFLLCIAALSGSCSHKALEPPKPLPTPVRASQVNSRPLQGSLDKLRNQAHEAEKAAERASSELEDAQDQLVKANELARKALEEHPDSIRVKELTEALMLLGGNLRAVKEENTELMLSLSIVTEEAGESQRRLFSLSVEISQVQSELDNYRELHAHANESLVYANKAVTTLNSDLAKSDQKLQSSQAWTMRWFWSTMTLLALNILYVVAKAYRIFP